ncbi:SRPBCC family protein [Streptomyces sp. NPDC060209]|uniref:SRPBCC family protein n=1 Tax=Streptomyces sp. NPDC060209 TaxID=3347073 RepID=UPI0036627044
MTTSDTESRHLSIHVERPAREVYDYASDPSHLPEWAAGLGRSIEETDGRWIADSPMGRVVVDFAPRNDYGVLDHHVTLPSGETVYNPVRVIADDTGCEVVFTLRRRPDVSAEEFRRDEAAVSADLATLKRIAERD